MKKVGLITYHSAYNYGSVYQAFATQQMISFLGYDCEIINYRMQSQKDFYKNIRFKYGIRILIKDLMLLTLYRDRAKRNKKFESFFTEYFHLTREIHEPEEAFDIMKKYDQVVSGSDQIWNKYSDELFNADWEYMDPYLLGKFKGKKISYASSLGGMKENDIKRILPRINLFDTIAMREKQSADLLTSLIGRNVEFVLDPTFLMAPQDWITKFHLQRNDKHYVLYYTLDGYRQMKERRVLISRIADQFNCKVILVTPLINYFVKDSRVEKCVDLGPKEFMNLLYNADHVITDSYHGTILSINFEKDVYSLCKEGGAEFRKTEVMTRLGMKERIIYSINDIINKNYERIDYANVKKLLDPLKRKSMKYLKDALAK